MRTHGKRVDLDWPTTWQTALGEGRTGSKGSIFRIKYMVTIGNANNPPVYKTVIASSAEGIIVDTTAEFLHGPTLTGVLNFYKIKFDVEVTSSDDSDRDE